MSTSILKGSKFVKKATFVYTKAHEGVIIDASNLVVERIGGMSEKGRVANVLKGHDDKNVFYFTLWLNSALVPGEKFIPAVGATYYIDEVELNEFTPKGSTELISRMEATLALGF